jgi:hypothetical protein
MAREEYFRQNRKERIDRERRKSFLAGFQAAQDDLLKVFKRIGESEMNGLTACEIVRTAKPDVPRETSTGNVPSQKSSVHVS